jgi:hypothetical protein
MLDNSLNNQIIKSDLAKKIVEKWDMLTNYDIIVNSDWSWFIDNISCPDDILMSWATIYAPGIITNWANSWSIYVCSWSSYWFMLNLTTNTDLTSFNKAIRLGESIDLTDTLWDLTWNFSSDSGTLITINSSSYKKPDWIDDNFNSDNYSSDYWLTIWENLYDNDSDARNSIIWYITKTWSLENIFWNNEIINNYIDSNPNNSDNTYLKIWDVNQWYLKLSVNTGSTIKIVKFDRSRYTQNKELFVTESFEWDSTILSWYIHKTWNTLSLVWSIWSSYGFDFTNNDYAIFIKNNWTWILNYKLTWDTLTKWIYINPINDSYPKEIKIMSYYITINSWIYIWDLSEYIKIK